MATPETILLAYFGKIGTTFPAATDAEVYALGLVPGLLLLIAMLVTVVRDR